MKIAVLGGGVIGVTTAYYLVRSGHEVVLFDRNAAVAAETSFANAGQVSPGYSSPWAGPGIPVKALRWLTMRHGPLALKPSMDPAMWRWLLAMLRNCTSARYAVNKARMVPLAEHSRDCLRALRQETGIAYDEGTGGTLQLFRTQRQLDSVAKDVEVLRDFGVPHEILDAQGCVKAEPGLAQATTSIAGGLRLPDDETGDCKLFTERLAELASQNGADIQLGTNVTRIVSDAGKIVGIATSEGLERVDACVVALGTASPAMMAPFGIRLPVYPVKGYSLTLPVLDPAAAPISTIMDETFKTAITRLGARIRVGGTAELSGFDLTLRSSRRAALEHSFQQLFPAAGTVKEAQFWCGLRPMTPDGPPIVGSTPVQGLYLNTGHGTLGWTMACGSAQVIADLIDNREPAIDMSALSMMR